MRVLFNNVNFTSRSGPNGFGLKLASQFSKLGHDIVDRDPDAVLNFIQGNLPGHKNVLRLDGIWFNKNQDWQNQNKPLKISYDLADSVIVQSEFNRELVYRYFGRRNNVHVINNGTHLDIIKTILPAKTSKHRSKNWLCASSWRPHKRLNENVRYFQKMADKDSTLYVAGSGDTSMLKGFNDDRIEYLGDLSWQHLISIMKSCSNFLHLAYLDHCPNVVVDARASGCKIHCSSSGGTKEIAGKNSVIILEDEWDFRPIALYEPPPMDFNNKSSKDTEVDIDVKVVAQRYIDILRG